MCPLLSISPLKRLFVSQSVLHTQRAAKVRNFVWFSMKMLRCRARALPSLYGYALVGHFYSATCARVRITIGAHAQYYMWCNWRILIRPPPPPPPKDNLKETKVMKREKIELLTVRAITQIGRHPKQPHSFALKLKGAKKIVLNCDTG